MQIAQDMVVVLDYTLTDDKGNVLDKSDGGQFAYLHGASNIIPGLEQALEGKQTGEQLQVTVAPEDGYGLRDDALSQTVSRELFDDGDNIEAGMQFHAQSPEGDVVVVTVTKVEGDQVTVDGNHPLAGVPLSFDVKIVDVRSATEEELAHGHVHGPGGHH